MLKFSRLSLPPAIRALLIQLVAFFIALTLRQITAIDTTDITFALLCGGIAALLSYFSGLARWWLIIQFLFVPGLFLMLKLNIPPALYLAAFILMLLVYWSTFHTQVPLYLSSKRVWQTLEELLPQVHSVHGFKFIDIGSGTGGVPRYLSKVRSDGQFTGIESAPLPYWISKLLLNLSGRSNCRIIWGSFWAHDLAEYDVVYAYLSPVPMAKLWEKIRREMRPGSLFISNTFVVPEYSPDYSITLEDLQHSTLHIWRIQARDEIH